MSKQPEWKYIANLGDQGDPIEYGGYFIYQDKTQVYPPEGEKYIPEEKRCYRFSLERMSLIDNHLISRRIAEIALMGGYLPHPLNNYVEWFDNDINSIASFIGIDPNELKRMFTSEDIVERAIAYESIGSYWGFENLDTDPLILTRKEAIARYKEELKR